MPHRRTGSPYYVCRCRSLPGYGDTGRLTSRTTSKTTAREMESTLRAIAEKALLNPAWRAVLDAVCRDRTIDLPTLLRHRSEGTLDQLRASLSDPTIEEAIRRYSASADITRQTQIGFDRLRGVLEKTVRPASHLRMSYLMDPRNIMALCHADERGESTYGNGPRKRNSVRRNTLRAISKLIRHYAGNAERGRIFADVNFPAEDDTRKVHMTPGEMKRLLSACAEVHDELALIVMMSVLTSADRGVLLAGSTSDRKKPFRGLRREDIDIYVDDAGGMVGLMSMRHDTKTKSRQRDHPLVHSLCKALLVQMDGLMPGDTVFRLSYSALDSRWQRAREIAGLTDIRFKDLRKQYSQCAEIAGLPPTVVSNAMGHTNNRRTQDYQRRRTIITHEQAAAIEAVMLGHR
ncbi:MAG: tyrosine-type recombinase/integrase [Bacteroidota bacterium]